MAPDSQYSLNTLSLPSWRAISPKNKCGGLFRPLNAAIFDEVKSDWYGYRSDMGVSER
ncbi:hypothetical protein AB6F62_20555 [Providencia huaxiensis]|uniref:hypothetical protein n=1 Tax=Providencia huaxiensis TaxID=2027290 RepID=UPI0034DCE253